MKRRSGLIVLPIIGLLLILFMILMLFTNEKQSVKRIKALDIANNAVWIDSNSHDSTLEGGLIIVSDIPEMDSSIEDSETGLIFENAITVKRVVEMYQWIETSESKEGETRYSYYKEWTGELIDSDGFNDKGFDNPDRMIYEDKVTYQPSLKLGRYIIESDYITQMDRYREIEYSFLEKTKVGMAEGSYIYLKEEPRSESPSIGDLRISYEVVYPEVITVMGQQLNEVYIVPYFTKYGDLAELAYGRMTKESLIDFKLDENQNKTFALRIIGIITIMGAFGMIFAPMRVLTDKIPFVGQLTSAATAMVSILLGGILGLLVVGFSWLLHKPFVSAVLLTIVVLCIILLIKVGRRGK